MAELTERFPVESKAILWLKWTGAFVLANAIMLPVMHFVPLVLPSVITQSNTSMNLVQLLQVILNGLVLSYISALALRSYLPNFSLWIFLSSITWALGSVSSISPLIQDQLTSNSPLATYVSILSSLAVLVPIGVVQWLMLRVKYQKSGFLILWYFGAGAAINLVFSFIFSRFPAISSFLSNSSYWLILGFNLLVEFCLFAIVGIGVVLVLRHPYPDQNALSAERHGSMENLLQWVSWVLAATTAFEVCRVFGVLAFFTQGIFSNPPWNSAIVGLFYGLLFGFTQFLFFRRQVEQAYLWIVASIIGGGLLFFCQGAGASINLITGSPNQPSAYLVLAFTALGWLALGVCQTIILNVWQYPRAWAWVQITFAAYGLSYLVQYFISQRLGLVLLPVLTGMGLLFVLKATNSKTWYVAPVDTQKLTPEGLETLRFVLQARLSDLFGKRMRVLARENNLAVFPVDLSLDETLTSLLTQPGKVRISRPTDASGKTKIATPAPILTDEDIISAEMISEGGPDKKLIRLNLTDEGIQHRNSEMKQDTSAQFFLFLDGEAIHNSPLDISTKDILDICHLDAEDARYYCAVLNNDPLPMAVSLDKEETVIETEELTAYPEQKGR